MHLNTTTCRCNYEFTKQDIKPPLMGQAAVLGTKQKNFYGGNVDKFSVANCPECGLKYNLWLRQMGQTWKVVTISASGWDPNTISEEAAAPVVDELTGTELTDESLIDPNDIDVVQTLIDNDEDINEQQVESKADSLEQGDSFDDMDKDALKAWLDNRSIRYHPQTGEKKLRDACRAALIVLADKENG